MLTKTFFFKQYAGIFAENTNIKVFAEEKRQKALQQSEFVLASPKRANKSDLSSASLSGDTTEQHFKTNSGLYQRPEIPTLLSKKKARKPRECKKISPLPVSSGPRSFLEFCSSPSREDSFDGYDLQKQYNIVGMQEDEFALDFGYNEHIGLSEFLSQDNVMKGYDF